MARVILPDSSFPVWLIAGLVCGLVPMILLLLLCLSRPSKDSCCISRSQRTNQGSDMNSMANHNGAQGGVYSTLLHGDAGLYESIKGPTDSATPARMPHFTKDKLKSKGNSETLTWSYRQSSQVFSCESGSREFSNAVNISIQG